MAESADILVRAKALISRHAVWFTKDSVATEFSEIVVELAAELEGTRLTKDAMARDMADLMAELTKAREELRTCLNEKSEDKLLYCRDEERLRRGRKKAREELAKAREEIVALQDVTMADAEKFDDARNIANATIAARDREIEKLRALLPAVSSPDMRAGVVLCDNCDGCGWYEGGPTLQTTCEKCGGTGAVRAESEGQCKDVARVDLSEELYARLKYGDE
jgi:hypothetical protein